VTTQLQLLNIIIIIIIIIFCIPDHYYYYIWYPRPLLLYLVSQTIIIIIFGIPDHYYYYIWYPRPPNRAGKHAENGWEFKLCKINILLFFTH